MSSAAPSETSYRLHLGFCKPNLYSNVKDRFEFSVVSIECFTSKLYKFRYDYDVLSGTVAGDYTSDILFYRKRFLSYALATKACYFYSQN